LYFKSVVDSKSFYHKSAKVNHCLLSHYTCYSTIMVLDIIMIKLEDIPWMFECKYNIYLQFHIQVSFYDK